MGIHEPSSQLIKAVEDRYIHEWDNGHQPELIRWMIKTIDDERRREQAAHSKRAKPAACIKS
jgi:hypothetical protein